jgi:peptidoglycan hydrolase-like protein with peptidoglycan-binding domain
MAKNKALPYIIFGVPLLIAGYFIYKAVRKPSVKADKKTEDKKTPPKETPKPVAVGFPLKKGVVSDYNVTIQKFLNITPTSTNFGDKTFAAVKDYQKLKGLTVDGVVGKNTWKSMFNADFPSVGAWKEPAKPQFWSLPPATINDSVKFPLWK